MAQLGPVTGVTYPFSGGLLATSAGNAWSEWATCTNCGGPKEGQVFYLERWTGRAWQRVSVPADVAKFLPNMDGYAATSAQDLWLFTQGAAAHWNGKHWGIMKIPSWVVRGNLSGTVDITVADFGPTDLWVFSRGIDSFKPTVPFAARFDGHHWRKVALPGVPSEVSVVGPDDIWATGIPGLNVSKRFLMHWNGNSWSTIALPKPRAVPAHFTGLIIDLEAVGPRDVWMQQNIMKGSFFQRTELFVHWNGRVWQTVHYPWPTSDVEFMTSDGHGGLWLSDVGAGRKHPRFVAHDSAGRWTRRLVPAPRGMLVQQLLSLTLIPGTHSIWATGGIFPVHTTTVVIGAIWKYGP